MITIAGPLKRLGKSARVLRAFFIPERGALQPRPFTVVALLGLALGLLVSSLSPVQRLDWALYDSFVVISTRHATPAPSVVVVAIDDPSFAEIGLQWPWPRSLHATLLRELHAAGARAVAFDIIFDTPSSDPAEDADFAQAVRESGNVVLATDWQETVDQGYAVTQWINPVPELGEAARGTGVARLPLDPDGRVRRAPADFQGEPSLALAAARLLPGFAAPKDPEAVRLLRWNGDSRFGITTKSYYQVLERLLPAETFRDKIVVVGLSLPAAPVLRTADVFLTPYPKPFPGVEIQATALDTLLRSRAIRDPFVTWRATALLGIAVAVVLGFLFYRAGAFSGFALTVGVGLLLVAGSFFSYSFLQTRIPVFPPLLVSVIVFVVSYLYRFILGIMERRMILGAFKHYLAPAIVDSIMKDPGQLRLGGAAYDVSVIFTDLAGFSTISERLSPEALHDLLTRYFREMMDILLTENATLDKFIGDAIMVYFGCPVADATHPLQACRSALRMQGRLRELNEDWKRLGYPPLSMRIGINSGPVVAGNMGTESIFNYTILGDNVNLASRLEGVNKEYGTATIISEDTYRKVAEGVYARELDRIRVKGKTAPVAIYELAALSGELAPGAEEVFCAYADGLRSYRERRWSEAKDAFAAILAREPADGPAATMKARADEYGRNPPPDDWDGVYTMLHK
jgi:adenylate cyclase